MSQLIRMRQRIKAIKTIKKITHALRLISMSTHLRLRSKKNALEEYKNSFVTLFMQLYKVAPLWKHSLAENSDHKANIPLIILIGSQKGLCGNFNTELYAFFEKELVRSKNQAADIIAIGKKAHDYAKIGKGTVIMAFDDFSITTIEAISKSLRDYILQNARNYSSVIVYSNSSKSFFVQKPQVETVIPFSTALLSNLQDIDPEEYIWEQKPDDILNFLIEKMVYVLLYELLFQSLIAEQAARFIAMDNSTRSAGKLLDSMQLLYNKMRQSKITGELTDLIGGFF